MLWGEQSVLNKGNTLYFIFGCWWCVDKWITRKIKKDDFDDRGNKFCQTWSAYMFDFIDFKVGFVVGIIKLAPTIQGHYCSIWRCYLRWSKTDPNMNIIILNRDYLVGRLTPECSTQIMLISTSDSDYQGPQETAGNDKALRCSIRALPRGPILLPPETPPAAPRDPSCHVWKTQVRRSSKPLGTNL